MYSFIAQAVLPAVNIDIPSGGSWPFWRTLAKWVGEVQYGAIVVMAGVLLVAVAYAAFGFTKDRPGAKAAGIAGVIIALIAIILIANAPEIAQWGSDQTIQTS